MSGVSGHVGVIVCLLAGGAALGNKRGWGMRITCLGHAGLHVETRYGTILCDPWVNPAYFESWFVFPDNQ